jgi:uncharacterized protein (UPF0264 family)
MMAKLLVSVRSADEAEVALEGGADIIDVKEPLHGSLGWAGGRAILHILKTVRGRVPVSAALGELFLSGGHKPRERNGLPTASRLPLNFVKWGLADAGLNWQQTLVSAATFWIQDRKCHPVAVAYADWRECRSPSPLDILDFVQKNRWGVLLLDTFHKDGRTLLDWMPHKEIGEICLCCKQERILIALAGSLSRREISLLLPLQPDVFAVRGAVCRGRDRVATVDSGLVRRVADLLVSTRVSPPRQNWDILTTAKAD